VQEFGEGLEVNVGGDERLQGVLRALLEAGETGTTRADLAVGLEISERTVDRHLRRLRADGAVIEGQREGRTTSMRLVLRDSPKWERFASGDEEMALEMAVQLLHGVGAQTWAEQLAGLTRFCRQDAGIRNNRALARFKSKIILRAPSVDAVAPKRDVLRVIMEALRTDGISARELDFRYLSAKKREEERRVIPYSLCYDATYRGAFLLAWDSQFQRPNFFRVSRILSATTGGRASLEPRAEETLQRALEYNVGGLFQDVPPFVIKVRIFGERWFQGLCDAPPTLPDFDITASRRQDGAGDRIATVTFKATELEGPCRWVLQFGSNAEVLAPESLRDWVRTRLEQSLAKYQPTL
jgi:predicted DNA-binding transcriptional regulator YafY